MKIYVDISIPGYVKEALRQFIRKNQKKASAISSPRKVIWCWCSKNEANLHISSTIHGTSEVNWKHSGKFLYYTKGVEKYLVPLSTITKISGLTEQDEKTVHQFLDYMTIYLNAVVRFHASDTILRVDTNALYLTEPQACSHAAGFFY